jgi:hypothetical protein
MGRRSRLFAALAITSAVTGLALRADSLDLGDPEALSELSGSYWYRVPNSTMNYRLIITSAGRFNLHLGGCFGSSEINQGNVAFRDGVLELYPRAPMYQGSDISTTLIAIQRQGRVYLVEPERLFEFTDAGEGVFVMEGGI